VAFIGQRSGEPLKWRQFDEISKDTISKIKFSGLSSRIQVLAHAMLTAMVILPRNCSIIKINSFEMHFRTAIGNLRVDRLLLVNIERSRDRCFNPLSIINDTITSYAPALLTCWGFCSSSYRFFFALSLS
jgi:hypothetical protein